MKIKNKIIFCIFFLFFIPHGFGDEIEFVSSNMFVEDNGNTIIAKNVKTIIKSENVEVISDKARYNKKDNIIIYSDNVIYYDFQNDIIIRGDRITYNKNKNLVYSTGYTEFDVKDKYKIDSKNVYYDRVSQLIYGDEKTIINDNKKNTYKLEERYRFDLNSEIIKSKKSNILDENENLYVFDNIVINLKNNEIAGKEIKIEFRDDYFGIENNDPILRGRSGTSDDKSLRVYKTVFSTCNIENRKCRGWELESEEFNHNKIKRTFEYKNSWFKMFNYKLLFTPYFSHPDPTVKRKSGFLTPTYSTSASLGTSFNFPYFKVLGPDKDLTLSPTYYADKSILLQNEYRQALKDSDVVSDFSVLVGDAGTKGHFFYNHEGKFNEQTNYVINLQNVRGDNYIKTYNLIDTSEIITKDNVLLSNLDLRWNFDDSKLDTSIKIYEDLSKTDDRFQYILPAFNFNKIIEIPENYNGLFNFNSSGHNKHYNSNVFETVLTNNFLFRSNALIYEKGLSSNYTLLLKNTNSYADNSTSVSNEEKYNLFETFKIDFNYPLKKKVANNINYLKPKASIRYSPNGNTNLSSKDMKINYDNAFVLDRISEGSQVEGGESLTLGLEFEKYNIILGEIFKFRIGNIIKPKENRKLPSKSKLNKTRSDIFGDFKYTLNENTSLRYAFSYDRDLEYSNLDSIGLSFGVNNFLTNFSYYTENHDFGDSENINNSTTLLLNRDNMLKFKTSRNLRDNFTEYYDLVYEYFTDCLSIYLTYNKSFYRDGSLKPNEQIFFGVKIIPFTEIGVENVEDLIAN